MRIPMNTFVLNRMNRIVIGNMLQNECESLHNEFES